MLSSSLFTHLYAAGCILKAEAAAGGHAQLPRCLSKDIWRGLAVRDLQSGRQHAATFVTACALQLLRGLRKHAPDLIPDTADHSISTYLIAAH